MASIRKRGPYQWQCRVFKDGVFTSKTFPTKAEAEAWAAVIESEMVRGVYISRTEAETTTLNDALERYAREIFPSRKDQGRREAYIVKCLLAHPLAKKSLASISSSDIAKYRDERLQKVSANTVRIALSLLSHMFTIATREWGIGGLTNPVATIRKPKLPPGRDRRLVGDEEERLLHACRESKSAGLEMIVRLALETGMRLSEMLTLEWSNVDLKKRTAHLPDTKNGESRDVPLSTVAIALLKSWPRNISDSRVFYEWKRADSFESTWRRAVKKTGLENFRFHDLRHEATSRFFEKGLNIMQVAAITGHKNLQMLKRYTHLKASDLAQLLG